MILLKAGVQIDYDTSRVVRGAREASRAQAEMGRSGEAASRQLAEARRRLETQTGRLNRAERRIQGRFRRIASTLDPGVRRTNEYRNAQIALDSALDKGLVSQREHARLLALAERRYRSGSRSLSTYTRRLARFSAVFAAASAAALGRNVLAAGRQEQDLLARLETAFQSDQAARAALGRIRSSFRPGEIAEVTQAFVKLQNFGLDPTIERVRVLTDFAAAQGKAIDQVAEAFLDASVGEFERLKELGIKARSEGDSVVLTFRGVETKVRKNADEIVSALLEIGRTNFAGAVARQAEDVSGKLRNTAGAWEQLGAAIFRAGVDKNVASAADSISTLLERLTQFISRGEELEGILDRLEARQARAGGGRPAAFGSASAEGERLQQALRERLVVIRQIERLGSALNDGATARGRAAQAEVDRLRQAEAQLRREVDLSREAMQLAARVAQGYGDDLEGDKKRLQELRIALGLATAETNRAAVATGELDDKTKSVIQSLEAEARVLGALIARRRDGAAAGTELEKQLRTLEQLGIPLDSDGATASRIRDLIALVEELGQKVALIKFEDDLLGQQRVLEILLETYGKSGEELDLLASQLSALERLGIPLDSDGEAADRVRNLIALVDRLGRRVAEIGRLDVVDVAPAPGTGPGFSTQGDPRHLDLRPQIDRSELEEADRQLKERMTDVGRHLGDALVGAIARAAQEGRVELEGLLSGLRGSLGGLFELGALRGLRRRGQADDAEAREAALGAAARSAQGVGLVLDAFFTVYNLVDSFVSRRQWERAHRGAVRLEQRLSGEVAGAIVEAGGAILGLLDQTARSAEETLRSILSGVGGTLDALSAQNLELRVRDGNQFSVIFNEAVHEFGTAAQEAFDFFILTALKQAQISGTSPEVAATLRNTRARSLSALQEELRLAEEIHQLPWSDLERSIHAIDQRARELIEFALRNAFPTGSFANIGADQARQIQDLRDALTGGGLSELERRRRDAETFNRRLSELRAQAQADLERLLAQLERLPGAHQVVGDELASLRQAIATGLAGVEGAGDGLVERLGRVGAGLGRISGLSEQAALDLERQIAALQGFLGALTDPIRPEEVRPAGGGGGGRRQARADFAAELERLRLLASGSSDVALALHDLNTRLEQEAERFRRAGVAEALIDEWAELMRFAESRDFFRSIAERGRDAVGGSDFARDRRRLARQHRDELAEARERGATTEQLTEILRVHRAELEQLAGAWREQRQAYRDLADGVSPWQRQLADLEALFEELFADTRALAWGSRGYRSELERLVEEQQAARRSLENDLLARLRSAGVELGEFGADMLRFEFAMHRADVATASLSAGFLDRLAQMGLTLEELYRRIDAAEAAALAGLGGGGSGGGAAGLDARRQQLEQTAESMADWIRRLREDGLEPWRRELAELTREYLEHRRAARLAGLGTRELTAAYEDAVERLLRQRQEARLEPILEARAALRDADPRRGGRERLEELLGRFDAAVRRARRGEDGAFGEAGSLSGEISELAGPLFGTAGAAFRRLLARLDRDLEGLEAVARQDPLELLAKEEVGLLRQIRDLLAGRGEGAGSAGPGGRSGFPIPGPGDPGYDRFVAGLPIYRPGAGPGAAPGDDEPPPEDDPWRRFADRLPPAREPWPTRTVDDGGQKAVLTQTLAHHKRQAAAAEGDRRAQLQRWAEVRDSLRLVAGSQAALAREITSIDRTRPRGGLQ